MRRTKSLLRALAAALAVASMAPGVARAAEAITKVRGRVVDINGKPMAKAAIWFDAVDIKKKVGPVRTNKDGVFIIATLDRTIAKTWRCYPDIPGYKVVKTSFEIVDSEAKELDKREVILGSKQEFPELPFPLVGDRGRNIVDFVVAKEADFIAAVNAERKKRETGEAEATAAGEAAPAAGTAGAPAAAPPGAGASLEQAKALTDAGRHEEAIAMYRAYLAKDPKGNPAVYYYLGKSLFESGDDAAAEEAFREGLAIKPDMKGAHFYLGNVYLRRSEDPTETATAAAQAVEQFQQESQLTPDSDSVAYNLGLALLKAGREDEALASLERAATLNPQRSEAYLKMAAIHEHRKDMVKAEEMYQKFSAADPANAAVSLYNIGVIAWNENRTKDAVQYFRKAVQIDPKYALAHRELGNALMAAQDFAGALKHFQEYLKLNPKAADARDIEKNIALLK
jgi:tetratricopeptide (TPR) repeat protein